MGGLTNFLTLSDRPYSLENEARVISFDLLRAGSLLLSALKSFRRTSIISEDAFSAERPSSIRGLGSFAGLAPSQQRGEIHGSTANWSRTQFAKIPSLEQVSPLHHRRSYEPSHGLIAWSSAQAPKPANQPPLPRGRLGLFFSPKTSTGPLLTSACPRNRADLMSGTLLRCWDSRTPTECFSRGERGSCGGRRVPGHLLLEETRSPRLLSSY